MSSRAATARKAAAREAVAQEVLAQEAAAARAVEARVAALEFLTADETRAVDRETFWERIALWVEDRMAAPGLVRTDCCHQEIPLADSVLGQQDLIVSTGLAADGTFVGGYLVKYRILCREHAGALTAVQVSREEIAALQEVVREGAPLREEPPPPGGEPAGKTLMEVFAAEAEAAAAGEALPAYDEFEG